VKSNMRLQKQSMPANTFAFGCGRMRFAVGMPPLSNVECLEASSCLLSLLGIGKNQRRSQKRNTNHAKMSNTADGKI